MSTRKLRCSTARKTRKGKIENLRLAYEEANRYLRHIDNFFWVISSFIITGSAFATSKALEWNGEHWQVLIYGIIIIGSWALFMIYLYNATEQSKYYLKTANKLEKELERDVLPKKPRAIFGKLMIVIAGISIILWLGIVLQYLAKNYWHIVIFVLVF